MTTWNKIRCTHRQQELLKYDSDEERIRVYDSKKVLQSKKINTGSRSMHIVGVLPSGGGS
jgi:hypothetical protein